ncbi:MAG: alpha/beta hydrolase, partial [bacterium]
ASASAPTARDSVRVMGGTLQYSARGKGMPIVLLSGGPGYAGSFLEPVFAHLSERHRVVLPDQRGTGLSVAFDDATRFTVANAVEDIEALRRRLGVERIDLIGHSWGGMLAMVYASTYPEHTSGLTLIGSGGFDAGADAIISERLRARLTKSDRDSMRVLSARLGNQSNQESALRAMRLLNWKAYQFDPANARKLSAYLTPNGFNGRTARWMTSDLERSRPRIATDLDRASIALGRLPVLIVYGEADVIGLATAPELRRRFPSAKEVVIKRSGHHPWIESPAALYQSIDLFLDDRP